MADSIKFWPPNRIVLANEFRLVLMVQGHSYRRGFVFFLAIMDSSSGASHAGLVLGPYQVIDLVIACLAVVNIDQSTTRDVS
jgi:hypothetical protein